MTADRDEATAKQLVNEWKATERPWELFHLVVAAALTRARQEGLEQAIRLVNDEPEFPGDPPADMLALMVKIGPVENARAVVRDTKRCIANAIRAKLKEQE